MVKEWIAGARGSQRAVHMVINGHQWGHQGEGPIGHNFAYFILSPDPGKCVCKVTIM